MDTQAQIDALKKELEALKSSFTFPRSIEVAIRERIGLDSVNGTLTVSLGGTGASTLTGILLGNGTSAITAIVPLSGTKVYYVSDTSGGAVTRKLTFTNGVLTSET